VKRSRVETVRRALPEAARPLVEALLARAEAWDLAVHLVGGPVRDHLRGHPLRDVDLAVEPSGGRDALALVDAVARGPWRVVAHPRFGTARVECGSAVVDVATVRAERYPHAGALPVVAPGTLEEDLRRRDFTVNALAIPLTTAARRDRPAVIDPAGGLGDLCEGRLRVLHPRSFHDDPTRALRAARLATRLGFAPTRGCHAALRSALRDGAFGAVSGERLRAELEKLFADAGQGLDPARALRLLADWHVLGVIEPGLTLPRAAVAPLRRLGAFLVDPPWGGQRAPGATRQLVAGLMLWLAPLETALRRAVLVRLAIRGEPARRIRAFPTSRDAWLRALSRTRGRGAADAVLCEAGEEELLALAAAAPANLRRRILRFAREDRHVALPVDGTDLLAAGLRGPAVGRALARIRAAFLDRAVRSREEALALVAELAQRSQRREPPPRRARR
jgi:tRNA nucleotidyltransferase (CCA-adding enzyme)